MRLTLGIHNGFRGRAQVKVLTPDPCGPEFITDQFGRRRSAKYAIVRPWQNNLILNSGLNLLAAHQIHAVFQYAAAGYGTSVADPTQTGLDTERGGSGDVNAPYRTNTYLTGAGNCGTTHVAGSDTYVYKRTYDFSIQISPGTYGEVGLSPTATRLDTLFSRIQLAGTVGVAAGQQLRLVYELTHTIAPVTPAAITPTITGWASTDGDHVLAQLTHNTISTNGTSNNDGNNQGLLCEPGGGNCYAELSDTSTALANYEDAVVARTPLGTAALMVAQAYVAGSHERDYVGTFTPLMSNSSAIRAICLGFSNGSSVRPTNTGKGWELLFDSAQEKLNTHQLVLTLTKSWNRV